MFSKNPSDPHAWVTEKLSEYIDDQLARDDRARVDAHLRECARCRASLASLQWTIALAKRAPAPALPRAFELPTDRTPSPSPSFDSTSLRSGWRRGMRPVFAFSTLRFATAFATIFLVAVLGIDFVSQFGGAQPAAPMIAQEFAAPTSAPAPFAPASGAQPTTATAPRALPPATQPQAAATQSPEKSAADAAPKASVPAPTRAPQTEARAEVHARENISPLRVIEIILLALVIAFGAATVIARNRAGR